MRILTLSSDCMHNSHSHQFCSGIVFGCSGNYIYLSNLVHQYRDRIYIRKDILLKLYENGELNQSKLMSYCGLNNVKHKVILDDMVRKDMIIRTEERWGNKSIIKYKVSEKGNDILKEILEPYESLFPRSEKENNHDISH